MLQLIAWTFADNQICLCPGGQNVGQGNDGDDGTSDGIADVLIGKYDYSAKLVLRSVAREITVGNFNYRIAKAIDTARCDLHTPDANVAKRVGDAHSSSLAVLFALFRATERASKTARPSLQTCSGSP